MVARFFLGLTEAGLFPGINYYLSCWYKRSEFGIRAAVFFSAAAVSGSFGGLLAAAIGRMKGVGGKEGWAWIFILEGLATVLIGIASFWMVFDFPDEATFLTPEDKTRVLRRLKEDKQSSAEHEEFQMKYFWASVGDWKTWLYATIYMGCDGPLYAFSLFLPSIINDVSPVSLLPPFDLPASIFSPCLLHLGDMLTRKDITARLQIHHHRPTPLCPSLRRRSHLDNNGRLLRRPHPPAWHLQHRLRPDRHDRLRHARCGNLPRRPLYRHLPRRSRHLPLYRQHYRLDIEQYRGCV